MKALEGESTFDDFFLVSLFLVVEDSVRGFFTLERTAPERSCGDASVGALLLLFGWPSTSPTSISERFLFSLSLFLSAMSETGSFRVDRAYVQLCL